MNTLTVTEHADLAARARLDDEVRETIAEAKAPNTRRAYAADWAHFTAWCEQHGEPALPAEPATVARYLTAIAGDYKIATLERRLVGVATAHRYAGVESPTATPLVRETLKGVRRRKAKAGERQSQKEAAVTDIIRRMVAPLGAAPGDIRDRALLLLGFAGAFRRSELVSLDVGDARFTREGVVVTLRTSKTDQGGEGMLKGIPYGSQLETCPVRSLQEWVERASITEGPLFRPIDRHHNIGPTRLHPGSVARIVKTAAERAGLDPALFSGHSLRAGLATAAAEAGVSEADIMAQTGHRSVAVARRYIRRGSLFRSNAAARVGL